jgi:hypothetical protein
LIMRALGKDPLRLRRGAFGSYWITREPPGPQPTACRSVLGEGDVVYQGIWRLHACAQEILACAALVIMMLLGRPDRTHARLADRAIHLHAVLRLARESCAFSDFGFLSRQRGGVDRRRRNRRGGAGRTVLAQEARRAIPSHAIEYCLAEGKVTLDQVDLVAFYDKPFLKFERLLETYLAFRPAGFRSRSGWRSRSGCAKSCF